MASGIVLSCPDWLRALSCRSERGLVMTPLALPDLPDVVAKSLAAGRRGFPLPGGCPVDSRRSCVYLQRAVVAIRHENLIQVGQIENTGRFGHAGHALNPFASGQINDLQRIIAKSGDEETLAFGVDGEVIEATLDSVHRNGVSEFEAGFLCK